MTNPTINLGSGKWATKEGELLGYSKFNPKEFLPQSFDVSRASSATVVNREGLIESVAANVARVDFSDDVNGALLLEPQSTNLITYSEDYLNWNIIGNGNKTALTLSNGLNGVNISTSNNRFFSQRSISVTSGVVYNFSAYFENVTGDLLRPIVGITGGSITGTTIITKSDVINGGRFSISFTPNFTGNITLRVGVGTDNNDSGSFSVSALQLEESSFATSYIPTSGTTVTRLADLVDGAGDVNTFNDSEGVLYGEILFFNPSLSSFFGIGVNSTNRILIGNDNGNLRCFSSISGTSIGFISTVNSLIFAKMAVKYKSGDFNIFINGSKVFESTTVFSPAQNINNLSFNNQSGGSPFFGRVKDLQYYNTALTDSELTQLTTI